MKSYFSLFVAFPGLAASFVISPRVLPIIASTTRNVDDHHPKKVCLHAASDDPEFYRRRVDKDVPLVLLTESQKKMMMSLASPKEDDVVVEGDEAKNMADVVAETAGSFPVTGQGAVAFTVTPPAQSTSSTLPDFYFYGADGQTQLLRVAMYADRAYLTHLGWVSWDQKHVFGNSKVETYWFSFDKEHYIVRMGYGYMVEDLILYDWRLTKAEWDEYQFDSIKTYSAYYYNTPTVHITSSKYPVYETLPSLVKDRNELTLSDLDNNSAISIAELSPECQRLYASVSGDSIVLNTEDFPDFDKAIQYSIKTEGCICFDILKDKEGEFGVGSDKNENYLRITLGTNKGDSPGIPYVMEIWPPMCYSPIHNHSNCNAIIKVLSGGLTTRWYYALDPALQYDDYYSDAAVSEGDVTWLDDRQFQTHQLYNFDPEIPW